MIDYNLLADKFVSSKIIDKDDIFYYRDDIFCMEFDEIFHFYQKTLDAFSHFGIGESFIYFDKDNLVNASAIKYDNFFCIKINKGLIYQAIRNFKNNNRLFLNKRLNEFSEFEHLLDTKYNVLIYQNIVHFVFYHELGHLIQFTGLSNLNNLFLQEQLINTSTFNLTKHLAEIDADEFSAIHMASHISQYFSKYKNIKNSAKLLNDILVLMVASIILYILLLPSNKIDLYYKKKSHPHPIIRVIPISFTIIRHLSQLLSKNDINIYINHNDIFNRALEIAGIIETTQYHTTLCQNFLKKTQKNSKKIRNYIRILIHNKEKISHFSVNRRNDSMS
jgi:hypothetical protein